MPPAAASTATTTTTTAVEALVVGAGWSGLVAALGLARSGRKVVVLEARAGRLGGRAFTHTWTPDTPNESNARTHLEDQPNRGGAPANDGEATAAAAAASKPWAVDFACSWIHGYNEGNPLKALAEKYNVPVHVAKPTPAQVIGPDGPLPKALSDKLQANLASAHAAAKRHAQSHDPGPDATLASFLLDDASAAAAAGSSSTSPLYLGLTAEAERRQAAQLARTLHVPLGAPLEQVALRWSGWEANFAGTDASPQGGFSRLIRLVADDALSHGAEIRTGEVVTSIERLDAAREEAGERPGETTRVRIVTRADEGKGEERVYEAPSALVTMPLAVLKERASQLFRPALPQRRLDVMQRTQTGHLNKILVSYPSTWWAPEVGTFFVLPTTTTTDAASPAPPPSSLAELLASTPLIVTSLSPTPGGLSSPQDGGNSLLVLLGADAARHMERYSRLEVAEAVHDYLAPRLAAGRASGGGKSSEVPRPSHSFYSRWAKQPFTRGATTTPVAPGASRSPLDFVELGRPLWDGALGFAGEHTDADHHGSVAGAYLSGEREAARIDALLPKSSSRL